MVDSAESKQLWIKGVWVLLLEDCVCMCEFSDLITISTILLMNAIFWYMFFHDSIKGNPVIEKEKIF